MANTAPAPGQQKELQHSRAPGSPATREVLGLGVGTSGLVTSGAGRLLRLPLSMPEIAHPTQLSTPNSQSSAPESLNAEQSILNMPGLQICACLSELQPGI